MTGVPSHVQITSTTGSETAAEAMAATLVDGRLAACVQVLGPIRSTYRWAGAVEREREWMCIAKTTASRADDVVAAIRSAHDYDNPEVTVVPIVGGSGPYLSWIDQETRGSSA